MLTAVEITVHAISAVVQTAPIGTNIALVHILWVVMSEAFLQSRGAFFTALHARGFTMQEVRRSWAALRTGAWDANELLYNWPLYNWPLYNWPLYNWPLYNWPLYNWPLYKQPLVLATNLDKIKAETAYHLYRDRWPVEQPPLAAKQMIGLHRQFVFADQSCFRLPELSLVAGAILTYVAAVVPPIPVGFWDRTPTATPGRLRRLLDKADFPTLPADMPQLRKKNSVTAHLPRGIDAHRRVKKAV